MSNVDNYAIVNIFGRQQKVSEGDKIKINFSDVELGKSYTFSEVLMIKDGAGLKVGSPVLENVKISAQVLSHGREPKILVFKYLRKNKLKKMRGHRQDFTMLSINKIEY